MMLQHWRVLLIFFTLTARLRESTIWAAVRRFYFWQSLGKVTFDNYQSIGGHKDS